LVTTLLSLAWLLHPNGCLFLFCVSLFVLLVIGTGIYGTVMSYKYL